MSNMLHFRHQTTGTKSKCIDRLYIEVIDRRIRDRNVQNDYELALSMNVVNTILITTSVFNDTHNNSILPSHPSTGLYHHR